MDLPGYICPEDFFIYLFKKMKRRQFIGSTTLLGAGVLMNKFSLAAKPAFPVVRVPVAQRKV
jgi:hypothetical protein